MKCFNEECGIWENGCTLLWVFGPEEECEDFIPESEQQTASPSILSAGSVPRSLSERDTSRLIALGVKYVDQLHPDWDELLLYVQRFDQSKKAQNSVIDGK